MIIMRVRERCINRMMRVLVWTSVIVCASAFFCTRAQAEERPYLCEIGLQGGCGYYVGDAAPHIFMHVREAYGLQFRYKFTKRWAVQAKIAAQRIAGDEYTIKGVPTGQVWTNQMAHADLMAEFNFFRFGSANKYDKRIRPYTPYIFMGLGASLYGDMREDRKWTYAGYLPLGIGFKWRFSEHCGLNIAWQHNVYFSDDIEAQNELNNKYHMNGWNWMNCDVTGMLTVGLVIEFLPAPRPCRICNN